MREMVSLFALVSPVQQDTVWESWLRFCLSWEERYYFAFTHLSCITASLHPDGIRTRSRYLKKIKASVSQKEEIEHIGFYLLPPKFYQAVFDFQIYLGLSLKEQHSCCEITVENHLLKEFQYQEILQTIKEFLYLEKVEVNLLPFNQTFNYNFNCILSPAPGASERDYGLIRRLYPAGTGC